MTLHIYTRFVLDFIDKQINTTLLPVTTYVEYSNFISQNNSAEVVKESAFFLIYTLNYYLIKQVKGDSQVWKYKNFKYIKYIINLITYFFILTVTILNMLSHFLK